MMIFCPKIVMVNVDGLCELAIVFVKASNAYTLATRNATANAKMSPGDSISRSRTFSMIFPRLLDYRKADASSGFTFERRALLYQ